MPEHTYAKRLEKWYELLKHNSVYHSLEIIDFFLNADLEKEVSKKLMTKGLVFDGRYYDHGTD